MDNENLFTTDTVPILTDFTTLDGSATSQGEITETEFSPMESRVGSLEDGLIKGSKINVGDIHFLFFPHFTKYV